MDINLIFVLNNDWHDRNDASSELVEAFELYKTLIPNITWKREHNCKDQEFLKSLEKTDVIVLDDFSSPLLEMLQENTCKCIIVGPKCLISCFKLQRPVPKGNWPIYNIALADCNVTASCFTKEEKSELSRLVQLMGGIFSETYNSDTTHLITSSVLSKKYSYAAEMEMPIMTNRWLTELWKQSQQQTECNINSSDLEQYRCPPLYKLRISTSGFTDRNILSEIRKIIVENGGEYCEVLRIATDNVLIVYGERGINGQKYKAACKSSNVKCVTVQWLHESIAKKYCQSFENYTIKQQEISSTPNCSQIVAPHPDFSTISSIVPNNATFCDPERTISQSILPPLSDRTQNASVRLFSQELEEHQNPIDTLDLQKIKLAGQFLDGFNIYLAGFDGNRRDKLQKILNLSGATRFDEITERISHVIVNDINCPDIEMIKSRQIDCIFVTIHWLIACIESKTAVPENTYQIMIKDDDTVLSTTSQQDIELLPTTETVIENALGDTKLSTTTVSNNDDDEVLQQYLIKSDAESVSDQGQDYVGRLFAGLQFYICDLDREERDQLAQVLESRAGHVIDNSHKCDYIITDLFSTTSDTDWTQFRDHKSRVVNKLWITECAAEDQLQPLQYFHRPLRLQTDTHALNTAVISFSGFYNCERTFLSFLLEGLGGTYQQELARMPIATLQIQASTHLIAATPDGRKFHTAVKWQLPVVDKQWLLDCAQCGQRLPIEAYLVSVEKPKNRLLTNVLKNSSSPKTPDRGGPVVCSSYPPDTPNTPYGKVFYANPTKEQHKEVLYLMNNFPKCVPPQAVKPRRLSTPLSELKRRLCMKAFGFEYPPRVGHNSKQQNTSEIQKTVVQKQLSFQPDPTEVPHENRSNSEHNLDDISAAVDHKDNERQSLSQNTKLDNNLRRLEEMLQDSASKRKPRKCIGIVEHGPGFFPRKDTQPLTVDWDYGNCEMEAEMAPQNENTPVNSGAAPTTKHFLISGVQYPDRDDYAEKIQTLGGIVSNSNDYDPHCTHLLCQKPSRNEKALSCLAAGKWILHISYIDASCTAGKFLDENEFEFGNEKCKISVQVDKGLPMSAISWWRQEISRRGYGAFNDMRAIVIGSKRDSIVRVIEAGGGIVVNARPPFDETVHATHCLLDAKSIKNISDFIPLAIQGVYCLNVLYINGVLYRTNSDLKEHMLPELRKYYCKQY